MKRTAEVIVVGGGVIGGAVAFELARRSVDVLLLDKSLPGRATSASAGGLWPVGEAIGLGCGIIHHKSRTESSRLNDDLALPTVFRDFLVQSNRCFPKLSEELREFSAIDIEYEPGIGLLFLYFNDEERRFVKVIADGLSDKSNFEILTAEDVKKIEPQLTDDVLGAAVLSGEHQVNPMLLAEGFKRSAIALGARFRHDTCATGLCREGDRIIGVRVEDEVLTCNTVVNAAGAWAANLAATAGLRLPIFPVRGQIVLTQALPHTLNACLSTSNCYMLQKRHGEVLVGSTTENAGFDVSVTTEAITQLCRAAVQTVPMLKSVGIKRVWSGLRPGTQDELPILGPVENVTGYMNATGGFRTGIVAAPLTGRVVAQSVVGESPDFAIEPFLTNRFQRSATTSAQ
jgi:glycine/D-amino acid oxidase-like deaminating enzyme